MIPQTATAVVELVEDQPGLTYEIDFKNGVIGGMIDDIDSIRQAIYLILNTERFTYEIHSWDHGVEFTDLIGKSPDYAYLEIERRTKEALLMDDRITGISSFVYKRIKNEVSVTFVVNTIIGDVDAERTVTI